MVLLADWYGELPIMSQYITPSCNQISIKNFSKIFTLVFPPTYEINKKLMNSIISFYKKQVVARCDIFPDLFKYG